MMKELIGQYINLSYLKYFGILAMEQQLKRMKIEKLWIF
jgi:hypothetical protein